MPRKLRMLMWLVILVGAIIMLSYLTTRRVSVSFVEAEEPIPGIVQIHSAGHRIVGGQAIKITGTTNYNGIYSKGLGNLMIIDKDNLVIVTVYVGDEGGKIEYNPYKLWQWALLLGGMVALLFLPPVRNALISALWMLQEILIEIGIPVLTLVLLGLIIYSLMASSWACLSWILWILLGLIILMLLGWLLPNSIKRALIFVDIFIVPVALLFLVIHGISAMFADLWGSWSITMVVIGVIIGGRMFLPPNEATGTRGIFSS